MTNTRFVTRESEIREEELLLSSDEALAALSDASLVERSADGDTAAFGVLIRRYGPHMRAYAARILGYGDGEADDAVQEAALQAWQRIDRVEDPERVRNWLFRIAANKALDRLRGRHPHADLEAMVDAPDERPVDEVVATRMQVRELARIVQALPDAQRAVWVMREVGGAPYAEIAEATGLPAPTVRGLLARARRHVLEQMEGWR
ncbi:MULTISPECIES: RNA polymerase sigma factor [unclassified Curtobacterium]|uniref:RNA polymerase sigma factor n=1 Tax=unclassified Curtobacterium TaxID=257496 RepID=UPI000F9EF77E|nr:MULTISPECIES: RNA polymerase sigma factor [unclassified Curtobacterium]ROQ16847.1 RNA polymerase sigma-70 factor (ECF subfamily) [Curtobacterium sp. PhB171]ROQ25076.1 RNA polymerase sigma-70 factor (ECF subfamily) [Curtobacterium sp. PhB170]ROS36527.1 RNA polymerase sigma-70 factor (ECF subfamily) [Curtobacterium sp. PhB131]ROS70200.1 RNA polymerase sigma-70 factor (ECF subfamily) [Curtobacterium sp. PhB172]ROS71205.1 RNA polymerase sigma-70 factor (ECF subfamily) [Curtobacterium sp. PhB141